MFDETSHEFIVGLVPVGAAAAWDVCAELGPQYVRPWSEQDDATRGRFVAAFAAGLEAMAGAADGDYQEED